LKEYLPGDSTKHIPGSLCQRTGLFTKQYGGDSSAEIWLDYNNVPGHNIESRLSQYAAGYDAKSSVSSMGFLARIKALPVMVYCTIESAWESACPF